MLTENSDVDVIEQHIAKATKGLLKLGTVESVNQLSCPVGSNECMLRKVMVLYFSVGSSFMN